MCILFSAIQQHPDYPLILCANRDEFFQRPTKSMHLWLAEPVPFYAGKDLEAGGSWLGFSKNGNFAAITNIRGTEYANEAPKSRGELVVHYLTKGFDKTAIQSISEQYRPFNFWYGNLHELFQYNSVSKKTKTLTPGFHSVSNSQYDDIWPKMHLGIRKLEHIIRSDLDKEGLLSVLTDMTPAEDDLLPSTGLSYEWEKRLSSIFILGKEYGTRASTIVMLDKKGYVSIDEYNFLANGKYAERKSFNFQLSIE